MTLLRRLCKVTKQILTSAPLGIMVTKTSLVELATAAFCYLLCRPEFLSHPCRMLALLLQSEKDAFRVATVEPIFQLKEDLKIRLIKEQHQQLTAYRPNWEQVIQQVPWANDIQL